MDWGFTDLQTLEDTVTRSTRNARCGDQLEAATVARCAKSL